MSMVGELTFFLGLQVKQKKEGIFVSQEKYARNIVKKFGLDSKKHASTPMNSSTKLNVDSSRVEVSPTLYRSIIGSLLYLTASKLDIAFNVIVNLLLGERRHGCRVEDRDIRRHPGTQQAAIVHPEHHR